MGPPSSFINRSGDIEDDLDVADGIQAEHSRRGRPNFGRRGTSAALIAVRQVPGPQRAALLAVLIVLTLVPAFVTSRGTQSTLHVDLHPAPDVRQAPGHPLPYVRNVLRSEIQPLLTILSRLPGNSIDKSLYRSIAVQADTSRLGAGVQLSALSPTPKRAVGTMQLVADRIATASSVGAKVWFRVHDVLLPQLALALTRPGLSSSARRRLLARELFVRAAAGVSPPAGPLRAGNVTTSLHGLRDRITALLPGKPGRPNPVWAAVAGFILGVCLCGTWIYLTAGPPARANPPALV